MKQTLDKVKNYFTWNQKLMKILFILCMIGVIIGSLYIVILNEADKTLVKDYITEYLNNITKLKAEETFLSMFLNQFLFILMIWLLGISVIGLPLILFFYFCKTFILGFSVSSFIFTKGFKGIFFGIGYVIPFQIIHMIIYLLLMNYALSLSLKLMYSFIKKKEISFKPIFKKYCIVFLTALGMMIISTLLESFCMPKVLSFLNTILK